MKITFGKEEWYPVYDTSGSIEEVEADVPESFKKRLDALGDEWEYCQAILGDLHRGKSFDEAARDFEKWKRDDAEQEKWEADNP